MIVLSGDLGGTKTLLRLSRTQGVRSQVIFETSLPSADFESFEQLLQNFLGQCPEGVVAQNVCIGIAGPIKAGVASVTNLPWQIHSDSLQQSFGFEKVHLLNDFQVIGYGLNVLEEDSFLVLQQGTVQEKANRAIIGAGTGLGEALLVWNGQAYEVLPSEGGHVSFAPTNDKQLQLLKYMRQHHDAVSYELLCSGPGLERIYTFVTKGRKEQTAAQISQAAGAGDPESQQAMELFVSIYGDQAGNLALTALATGGVFIAGGIAPKIIPHLSSGLFMKHFCNKSKMGHLLQSMPVKVVTESRVGLLGAEYYAANCL